MLNQLLEPSSDKYVVFTDKASRKIVEMCDKQEANLWLASDINLTTDASDWNKMTPDEQHYLKQVLAFFAASDGLVGENLATNFLSEVQIPEVRYFYYFQSMMEAVHAKTYSNLITTFITSSEERDRLFNSLQGIPSIKDKGDWAFKFMNPKNATFSQRLLAFLAVEGIFFAGSFAIIFWLRDRGILANSLGVANEYISRDECHIEGTKLLTNKGFIDFKDVTEETIVGQFNKGVIEWVKPTRVIKNYTTDNLVKIHNQKTESIVTKNHDIVFYNKDKEEYYKEKVSECKFHPYKYVPITARLSVSNKDDKLTDFERFCLAMQADGSILKQANGDVRGKQGGYGASISLTRPRKKQSLIKILEDLNYDYRTIEIGLKTQYKIKAPIFEYKNLEWVYSKELTYEWCVDFIEEVIKWDGSIRTDSQSYVYCSTNKSCVDVVQFIATLAGYRTTICANEDDRKETYKRYYRLSIYGKDTENISTQTLKKTEVEYEGYTYCVEVPSGAIVTSFNDRIFIGGNCLHAEFASLLYKEFCNDLSKDQIKEILLSALEIEKKFIAESIPNKMFGMNQELMFQYLESVTDSWLKDLGCDKVFNVEQPFGFMDTIGMRRKDNFFEKSRTNYARHTENKQLDFGAL